MEYISKSEGSFFLSERVPVKAGLYLVRKEVKNDFDLKGLTASADFPANWTTV